MRVSVHEHDTALVLEVSGEVDMISAPRLREQVNSALETHEGVVVIDLLDVTFFGSSGLAVLVEARQLADGRNRLRLVADGPATLRPLQVTGLVERFSLYPTRNAALIA